MPPNEVTLPAEARSALRDRLREAIIIGIGGFLGANMRYFVATWAADRFGPLFPYGTLLINVSGSFVIGLFLTVIAGRVALSPDYRLFFSVGFLGAYTTFSAFTYETFRLIEAGNVAGAIGYFAGSGLLGMIAVVLGIAIGRALA